MRRLTALLFLAALAAKPPALPKASDLAAKFGAREAVRAPALSPQGSALAWISPLESDRAGAFVYDIKTTKLTALITDRKSILRLRYCAWKSEQRLICVLTANEFNENTLLGFSRVIAIDRDGGKVAVLGRTAPNGAGDLVQSSGDIIALLPDEPDWVLMAIGSPGRLSVERVNVRTNARRQQTASDSAIRYLATASGEIVARETADRDFNGQEGAAVKLFIRLNAKSPWRLAGERNQVTGLGGIAINYDEARRALFIIKGQDGRDALFRRPLDGGPDEPVFAHPKVDVDGLLTIGKTGRPVAATFTDDYAQYSFFDPALTRLTASMRRAMHHDQVAVLDESWDGKQLLVYSGSDTDPGWFSVYHTATRELETVYPSRPDLANLKMAPQRPITYRAADGTEIPAFLTLPPGRTEARGLPAIVLPHGGPSSRDVRGFDWLPQFFAQSGYAVLQPNYRGSTGYGAKFLNENGFRQWRTSIGDINDGARWLLSQGVAPGRLGIVGWSYGGYAALQTSVLDPALFKAIVAIAPVTDIPLLKQDAMEFTNGKLTAQFLGAGANSVAGSPARHAARIKAPVFLFHGDRDLNVGINQSRRMNAALGRAGVDHQLVTYPGLDHQLDDGDARADMLRRAAAFLAQHLAP